MASTYPHVPMALLPPTGTTYGLIREMARDPGAWQGRRVLFVHTGGALGVYDKLAQLQPIMEATAPSRRFDVADVETA